MLNPFCSCFNFWPSGDDQIDLNHLIEKEPDTDVTLDVSKAGLRCSKPKKIIFSSQNMTFF
jgi:hypothetical protein